MAVMAIGFKSLFPIGEQREFHSVHFCVRPRRSAYLVHIGVQVQHTWRSAYVSSAHSSLIDVNASPTDTRKYCLNPRA